MAGETAIHQRRVSVPSVAVGDFARQIFERFDDKLALVVGAGEMAEETLRYLHEEAGVTGEIEVLGPDADAVWAVGLLFAVDAVARGVPIITGSG